MIGMGLGVMTSQGASWARQSRPASSNSTRRERSSDSRAARTAPAEPPPTTMTSYMGHESHFTGHAGQVLAGMGVTRASRYSRTPALPGRQVWQIVTLQDMDCTETAGAVAEIVVPLSGYRNAAVSSPVRGRRCTGRFCCAAARSLLHGS